MTSQIQDVEALYLPEEMRRDLCVQLLEEAGASKIKVIEHRSEINHCCPMPWHNENRPSASLNWKKMVFVCLGCQARGGILWLVSILHNLDDDGAKGWLSGKSGFGGKDFQLAPLLQYLDAIDAAREVRHEPAMMPVYSEVVLEPWDRIYPGLTTGVPDLGIVGRGIPEENLKQARVGWDFESNRVIIPNFWDGNLVGWQSRRIVEDGTPKYRSTPSFPRDHTVYGYDGTARKALWVESPMSRLRHMHHLPVESTWGAAISAGQIALLKWHETIVMWPDPDEAGWKAVEGYVDDEGTYHPGAAEQLSRYSQVLVTTSDWYADPAELDDDEARRIYEEAVPLSIWERPTGALRCLVCEERHGGPCS